MIQLGTSKPDQSQVVASASDIQAAVQLPSNIFQSGAGCCADCLYVPNLYATDLAFAFVYRSCRQSFADNPCGGLILLHLQVCSRCHASGTQSCQPCRSIAALLQPLTGKPYRHARSGQGSTWNLISSLFEALREYRLSHRLP